MKEIITQTMNDGKFRIRVVKLSGTLVAIEHEANYGDVYGWVRTHKPEKIHRDEITAAAKLLNIKGA